MQTTTDTTDETETLNFEVYHDASGPQHGEPEYFAVLTFPGPDVPRDALTAAQDATDARVEDGEGFDLENGEGHDPAGTLTYTPGKDDGEVKDVTFTV